MNLHHAVNLVQIANDTHGYVGADLALLCSKAALQQIQEIQEPLVLQNNIYDVEVLNSLAVTQNNFLFALTQSYPSALREIFVAESRTKWDDVDGLGDAKHELQKLIRYDAEYPKNFLKFDKTSCGVLLFGQPGCGK
jgi:transitional endoplasmic reticulum ATPase